MLNNCSCSTLITALEDEHWTWHNSQWNNYASKNNEYIVQIAAERNAARAYPHTVGAAQVGIWMDSGNNEV